jgi:hypothetical protein
MDAQPTPSQRSSRSEGGSPQFNTSGDRATSDFGHFVAAAGLLSLSSPLVFADEATVAGQSAPAVAGVNYFFRRQI